MAQGFQIDKLFTGDGKLQPAINDPRAFNDAALNFFNSKRGEIETAVRKQLGPGNLIGRGITLYNTSVRLGQPSMRFLSNNQAELWLRGNHIYAKSTTPTALGSWADPAFEVNFDVRVIANFTLPEVGKPKITVTSANLSLPWIQLKPRNVAGGVITTVGVITNFFLKATTGRDLIRQKLAPYLTHDITNVLNARLAPINSALQGLHNDWYRTPKISRTGDLIKIVMEKYPAIKPVGRVKVTPATNGTAKASSALGVLNAQQAQAAKDLAKGTQTQVSDAATVLKAGKQPELLKKAKVQSRVKLPSPIGPIVK